MGAGGMGYMNDPSMSTAAAGVYGMAQMPGHAYGDPFAPSGAAAAQSQAQYQQLLQMHYQQQVRRWGARGEATS